MEKALARHPKGLAEEIPIENVHRAASRVLSLRDSPHRLNVAPVKALHRDAPIDIHVIFSYQSRNEWRLHLAAR